MSQLETISVFSGGKEEFEEHGRTYHVTTTAKYDIQEDEYIIRSILYRHNNRRNVPPQKVYSMNETTDEKDLIAPRIKRGIWKCKQQAVRIESRSDVDIELNE